jgi:hypothetical protein
MRATMRWTHPRTRRPDISPAIPAMISRGPDIFPSRTYDAALHERTRRCDLDDDLRGARNDRKPRPDESSEQDFSNHVFSFSSVCWKAKTPRPFPRPGLLFANLYRVLLYWPSPARAEAFPIQEFRVGDKRMFIPFGIVISYVKFPP